MVFRQTVGLLLQILLLFSELFDVPPDYFDALLFIPGRLCFVLEEFLILSQLCKVAQRIPQITLELLESARIRIFALPQVCQNFLELLVDFFLRGKDAQQTVLFNALVCTVHLVPYLAAPSIRENFIQFLCEFGILLFLLDGEFGEFVFESLHLFRGSQLIPSEIV